MIDNESFRGSGLNFYVSENVSISNCLFDKNWG